MVFAFFIEFQYADQLLLIPCKIVPIFVLYLNLLNALSHGSAGFIVVVGGLCASYLVERWISCKGE